MYENEVFMHGDEALLIGKEGNTLSLKKILSARAVTLHDEVNRFRHGEQGFDGKEITEHDIELDIAILNTLSNAYRALHRD